MTLLQAAFVYMPKLASHFWKLRIKTISRKRPQKVAKTMATSWPMKIAKGLNFCWQIGHATIVDGALSSARSSTHTYNIGAASLHRELRFAKFCNILENAIKFWMISDSALGQLTKTRVLGVIFCCLAGHDIDQVVARKGRKACKSLHCIWNRLSFFLFVLNSSKLWLPCFCLDLPLIVPYLLTSWAWILNLHDNQDQICKWHRSSLFGRRGGQIWGRRGV